MAEGNTAAGASNVSVDPELANPAANTAASGITRRDAPFGTSDEEIARLLRHDNLNYYAVFKIENTTEGIAQLRKHYFKISRLVHPDKCSHPDAGRAMALVAQANDTLTNPVKKRLYDSYATEESKPEGMSFAEWESRRAEVPKWLERILRIPGGGCCLLILLMPGLLLLLLLYLLCLPVRCFCWICCSGRLDEEDPEQSDQQQQSSRQSAEAAASPSQM